MLEPFGDSKNKQESFFNERATNRGSVEPSDPTRTSSLTVFELGMDMIAKVLELVKQVRNLRAEGLVRL